MKIELKKIQSMDGHEGLAWTADLYIEGVNVGTVGDEGNGGETEVRAYGDTPQKKELIEKAHTWAESLPEWSYAEKDKIANPTEFDLKKWKMDLKTYCENMFWDIYNAKAAAKRKRLQLKQIEYGNPKGYAYKIIKWKGKTLAEMASQPTSKMALQATVNRIKKELPDGHVIFNADYLRSIGINV